MAESEPKPLTGRRAPVKFSGLIDTTHNAPHATTSFSTSMPDRVAAPVDPAAQVDTTDWELVEDLDLALVIDSPYQLEEETNDRYDAESIGELGHSIASEGQREPIQVRRVGARYELISGHRRVRALRLIGRAVVRALVGDKSDEEAERALMVHNEGRKADPDFRKAVRYQRAKDKGYARTQKDIAAMFATQQPSVSKRLRMLDLPRPILAFLEKDPALFSMITASVILELLVSFPDEIEVITMAVEKIALKDIAEGSVKSWVVQTMAARKADSSEESAADVNTRVVSDERGRSAYTLRLKGNMMTLRLHGDANGQALLDEFAAYLKTRPALNASGE